ncbi:unnamed protein product [Cylindrotheca closterium]|uniref:NmrA-like domain-containing protein n=1 Tax=Cylindrotheca closterium TaxID=2856 RepID=A0AAD2G9B1_9STRA|nr:unnamed protein product [Cylindrotheca closterium]
MGTKEDESIDQSNPALVFGVSGEQGRSVAEGLANAGYAPVYGFTSNRDVLNDQYLSDALNCILLEGSFGNPKQIEKALVSTRAKAIFVTTTTQLATDEHAGFQASRDDECDCIIQFFATLKKVYDEDKLERTVVFSTHDNVEALCRKHKEATGEDAILPQDDGSIVPHYSAKGRGGEEALKMLQDTDGINLILLSMPFFYSNFLGFFAPLPNQGRTQWELTAAFGDGSTKIDMMDPGNLGRLVASLCSDASKYRGKILKVAGERISMDEIAETIGDLFGKDVIYNPLLPEELASMDFKTAPAMAQMCQFLASPLSQPHDLDLTKHLLAPRAPTSFSSWLLAHSDGPAFTKVGLDQDSPELTKICVFGATSIRGQSVIQGLLKDDRKSYLIRATTRQDPKTSLVVQGIVALDPSRIEFVQANYDDVESCRTAVEGMDGVFMVADLRDNRGELFNTEEHHVHNIIDASEGKVQHLVFSALGRSDVAKDGLPQKDLLEFSSTAQIAAYSKSKKLSCTFIVMPCFPGDQYDIVQSQKGTENAFNAMLKIPSANGSVEYCISVNELGPAVADIFDSFEVFSGHELALLTNFVTVEQAEEVNGAIDSKAEFSKGKTRVEADHTYMKDLGQLFSKMSHSTMIAGRHETAKTLNLIPNAQNLKGWVEHNSENVAFREKLGIR